MTIGGVTVVPQGGSSGMSNIQKPANYICDLILDRDALILSPSAKGSTALVKDAGDDPTVDSGWAWYSWDGEAWTKTAEGESLEHGRNCIKLSPDASVFGIDNISGGYAARISAYDSATKKITLLATDDYALEPEKYVDGADIYIALNVIEQQGVQKYTIVSSTVTIVDSIDVILSAVLADPTGGETPPEFDSETSNWIAVVEWPDSDVTTQAEGQGNFVSGESAGANGSYNMIVGLCSHAHGVGNTLIGDITKVYGNGNIAIGNSLSVCGTANKVSGMFTFVNGSQNEINGDLHSIHGDMNTIIGDNITVNGDNNKTVVRTRIDDDGNPVEEKPRQVYIAGTLNEINADYTHTCGYRLTNRAKHAVMVGRDTYLDDSPENEGAFIVGGGELNNPRNAFEIRSRRKITNPLYNPVNDPDGNGVDSDGEKQYISQLGFMTKYLGHLLSASKTQTVNNDSGTVLNVSLDHDYYGRWKITPTGTGQITFSCDNWEDGDSGELIIYAGAGRVVWPATWLPVTTTLPIIGDMGGFPDMSSGGYVILKLSKCDNEIIVEPAINNTGRIDT